MEYLVVIEKAEDGTFSAYVPDLPGCVSSGDSVEELEVSIREAIRLHIESLRDHHEHIPEPKALAVLVSA
jgi:predicted RNase H-like HicB family nuclease